MPGILTVTYIPSYLVKKNRSRIDFFLISNTILPLVEDVFINQCLQSKMFDHKAVHLSFKKKRGVISRPTISHAVLQDPDLDMVVGLAVLDTYLTSSNPREDINLDNVKISLGNNMQLLRDIGPADKFLEPGARSEQESLIREGNIARIREFLESAPYVTLRDAAHNVDDDIFMEGLINNVRNQVISHQCFILKESKKKETNLKTELKNLYRDHSTNLERIIEIETVLSKLNDDELRREVVRIPGFEVLHSEKITPYFLSLAKGSQSEASMSDICDSNGQPFESLEDMKGFVKNFYSNIYKNLRTSPIPSKTVSKIS